MVAALIVLLAGPQTAHATVYDRTGNIKTWVLDWVKQDILASGSNAYRVQTETDLNTWRQVMTNLYTGNLEEAADLVSSIAPYYKVVRYSDTSGTQTRLYYLLVEGYMVTGDIEPVTDTGWGVYVFDPEAVRELTLQAPHPIADRSTDDEAIEGLLVVRPRALMLFTSHRCASLIDSAGQSGDNPCDPTYFRMSDAPHAALSANPPLTNPFQIAHEELVKLYPGNIAIQFHGNASGSCPQIFLSNTGSDEYAVPDGNVSRLRQNLLGYGFRVEAYGLDSSSCGLAGTLNLQGRYSNGSKTNPVSTSSPAPRTVETFIHVEQAYANVRDSATNRRRVLDAIVSTSFVISPGQTYSMNITGYGWPDNSPPGADIAYPEVRGRTAAGGTGTFSDPITFATDSTELPKGTLIYVPHLKRYFIHEDECVTCEHDWVNHVRHIDLWVGGTTNSPASAVYACENAITRLPGDVIVNPPPNLAVASGSIFNASTNQCDAP